MGRVVVYAVGMQEEGGKEAEAFGAENIDQILQKRTETRAIGG